MISGHSHPFAVLDLIPNVQLLLLLNISFQRIEKIPLIQWKSLLFHSLCCSKVHLILFSSTADLSIRVRANDSQPNATISLQQSLNALSSSRRDTWSRRLMWTNQTSFIPFPCPPVYNCMRRDLPYDIYSKSDCISVLILHECHRTPLFHHNHWAPL